MSFTPSENPITHPERESYTELRPFRFWCQKVLPLVYDDTLSYYELLCKVVDYLNKTMEDVEHMNTDMDTLYSNFQEFQEGTFTIYNELVTYVNNYFDNLDVQEEINNKLDAMVTSGELVTILQPTIADEVASWLTEHLTPTTPAIDNTLSVSGAGADAKRTGDIIARQYLTIQNYNVGEYVIYNGELYECTTNITAESWTPEHWKKIQAGTELSNTAYDYKYFKSITDYKYLNAAYNYVSDSGTGSDGLLRTDNTDIPGTGYKVSKNVNAGDIYKISGRQFNDTYAPAFLLRNNGNIVYVGRIATGYFTDHVVVIPDDVDELVVNLNSDRGASTALKRGIKTSANSILEMIQNDVDDLQDLKKDYYSVVGNEKEFIIVDKPDVINGAVNRTGGVHEDGTTYHSEISVNEGDVISVSGIQISDWFPLGIFCDVNDNVVGVINANKTGTIYGYTLFVPDGASKAIINGNADTIALVDYRSNKYLIQDYWWTTLNIAAETGVVNTSGGINTDVGHHIKVNVQPHEKYKITGKSWSAYFPAYVISNGNSVIASGLADTEYFTDYEITIPDDGYILYVNGNAVEGIRCSKYARVGYEPKSKELIDKTMVWFGTSIPQNSTYFEGNTWSIPSYVGKILNMNVINECLGASIAARGIYNKISENDPYGWTGVSWYAVFRALGANLTEKEDLINNYNSKWYDLIGGSTDPLYVGAKPQTLTDDLKAQIRGASYENRLIPYLDGTKPMPDLFVFEHGYNDSQATVFSGISPDEEHLNRSLYSDAMYFFIQKIFEVNPQAKIMIVSHYDNSSVTGKKTFAAQKELAEYHGLYFCNVADNIGWTQRLVKTTGYWNNGIWVESGGEERTITRLAQCIPDQVHPHTDKSGNAIKREAQIIADFIKSSVDLDT